LEWHRLGATGSHQDLWVAPQTRQGNLSSATLPDGRDARAAIRTDGPTGLGVEVWFAAEPDHRGTREQDMIWDTGRSGVKIVSDRLSALLTQMDPTVAAVAVDLRGRRGVPITGYVALMEQVGALSPVHSMKRRARGSAFVVSSDVKQRIVAEGFSGLDWQSCSTPFPADQPPG
jgi:hypothetical protein